MKKSIFNPFTPTSAHFFMKLVRSCGSTRPMSDLFPERGDEERHTQISTFLALA